MEKISVKSYECPRITLEFKKSSLKMQSIEIQTRLSNVHVNRLILLLLIFGLYIVNRLKYPLSKIVFGFFFFVTYTWLLRQTLRRLIFLSAVLDYPFLLVLVRRKSFYASRIEGLINLKIRQLFYAVNVPQRCPLSIAKTFLGN